MDGRSPVRVDGSSTLRAYQKDVVNMPDSASASTSSEESRRRVPEAEADQHRPSQRADSTGSGGLCAPDEHARITAAFQSLPEAWQVVLWHGDVLGTPLHGIGALTNQEPDSIMALLTAAREGLQSAYQALVIPSPKPKTTRLRPTDPMRTSPNGVEGPT